ncbi:probable proton-coupled zinc antiporter SLC30A4 isoform X2 [Carassius carassius]|uniref:probable proton-coupled zinc antiporter SLC30A4 isoform X2 n=1 Tax=Carassius carassius TaxID=217509 RepID=UPI0028688181|nr:probable proton-coupled zinc antiporter SLC30A4 isoform X2 [Carassius carassius]
MSVFSEPALEKKLSELSNSQQSVQTLSLWLIHHRKHSKTIVKVWYNELRKAQVSRKLTFLYLANDVIQNSKRKGPEFTQDFSPVIVDAFKHVSSEGDESCKKQLGRVLSIWQERAVYENDILDKLSDVLQVEKKAKKRPYEEIKVNDDDFASQSSPAEPPQTANLIRALQELENEASSDAALRQRISALPPEVQDTSLLHKVTDKESGERLSRLVEEACMLLADYSGRLAAEIDDRRQLTRTLAVFLQSQRDGLAQNEQKLEEYKRKLARVSQVRKELRSRLSSLPDLSRLPNVTGGHVRLPSSGDLYSPSDCMSSVEMNDSKHCHDNSRALEDREREKKLAKKRLYIVSVVCLVFMIGEILGGYFAGSLAVMTDAAHLLVDLTSFIISLCSLWLSSRPATRTLNYGWHRAEILGALLSVFTIWLVTGVLVYLAVERLIQDDFTIEGTVMLITSGCAVLANIIMAFTLHQSGHGHSHGGLSGGHGHSHDHRKTNGHSNSNANHYDIEKHGSGKRQQANASVRAAFVHVIGDLLQSVSVLVSALIIFFKPEYKIADPICTFLFSIFVLGTTITIMRDIIIVLMEGTPAGVNYNEVREQLLRVKGVKAVHNLHIWALTMNQAVLSAHVAIDDTVEPQAVLREMTQTCFTSYNFHSVTIQLEHQADQRADCNLCEDPTK